VIAKIGQRRTLESMRGAKRRRGGIFRGILMVAVVIPGVVLWPGLKDLTFSEDGPNTWFVVERRA
jgi:hypothetical protein